MGRATTRELILRARERGVEHVRKELDGLRTDTAGVKKGWAAAGKAAGVAGVAMAAAAAGAGAAMIGFGKSVIGTGAQVEEYKLKLETVLHSTEKANRLYKSLVQFASTTPFELPGVIEAAVQLESFGFDAEELLPVIGDTAAAMGADIRDASQAFTQGVTGEMEMLKRFTITGAQLKERIGNVNRGTIEGTQKTAEAITAIMEEKFGGGMIKLAHSWRGTLSMFSDHWFKLKAEIAEGGVFDTIEEDLRGALKRIDEFSGAGGIQAIATGFNNAFEMVHELFFEPLFGDFNTTEFKAAHLALKIEKTLLSAATAPAAGKWGLDIAGQLFGQPSTYSQGLADLARVKARMTEIDEGLKILTSSSDGATEHFAELAEILGVSAKVLNVMLGDAESFDSHVQQWKGQATPLSSPTSQPSDTAAAGAASFDAEAPVLPGAQSVEDIEAYYQSIADLEDDFYGYTGELVQSRYENEIAYQTAAQVNAQRVYFAMARYQEVFTRKGMKMNRALNAMAIRGIGEVGKAIISEMTSEAKLKALKETAEAIAAAARYDFASAGKHAAAAAGYGLIVGAGGVASALIEREVSQREGALLGEGDVAFGGSFGGGGARSHTGRFKGSASTVRTGPQVNNFYITLTTNVAGDYNTMEGDASVPDQIQGLFEEGLVAVPQR